MKAILLTEDNLEKIYECNTTINDWAIEPLLKSVENNPNYFVPHLNEAKPWDETQWGLIPETTMDARFKCDKETAATEFVEIERI